MIVALDIGLKRIGVALCFDNGVCVPINAVIRINRNQAADEISRIIATHKADKIVVGIPKGGASENEMSKRIKYFVNLIKFSGEICYIDESFSSEEASNFGKFAKKDGKLDSLSALVILKRYLKI